MHEMRFKIQKNSCTLNFNHIYTVIIIACDTSEYIMYIVFRRPVQAVKMTRDFGNGTSSCNLARIS